MTEESPIPFGEVLRSHRLRARLTQQELAERSGLSVRALRYIERGGVDRPRLDTVRRLAAAVGVPADDATFLAAAAAVQQTPAPRVRVGILGPLSVDHGDRAIGVGALKQRTLLALLALRVGTTVRHDEIVDVLWGEDPPESCLGLVHTYISRLRRALTAASRRNADVIASTPGGYRLDLRTDQLDMARFDDLVAKAQSARLSEPDRAADLYDRALASWRGPALSDLPALREHPAVIALNVRRRDAVLAHADLAIELGRFDEVVLNTRGLVHDEPLHEGLHARLILGLAGTGEQAAALGVFADIRARLDEELGIEPGAEIRQAHLRVLRGKPEPAPQRAPAQLPAETPGFVGRADAMARLDSHLADLDGHSVVIAVSGSAGVGKTALAVRWAHRVRPRFPDGQLSVNLQGYAAGHPPTVYEVLVRFVRALGVAPERVPADIEEAAGLYRTMLTGKKVLILLDNAATAEQVRPLLPGSPGCLVLVTSRDRLTGLTARDGAHQLPLDVLAPEESVDLLGRLVGVARTRREATAAAEMADTCAHLPLALRIAGANLAIRPLTTVADYTRELRDRGRMAGLAVAGDESAAVRVAFDLSYTKLTPAARRLFRLLGLVPGTDIDAPGAAALVSATTEEAARLLRVLDHGNLIREHTPGRYTFHDLLREYAADRAGFDDEDDDRHDAVVRLFDHYLKAVRAHSAVLWQVEPAESGGGEQAAISWLDAERANLVDATLAAGGLGLHSYAWRFAEALRSYFSNRGHGDDGIAVCTAALTAARNAGDVDAEASVHELLGQIYGNLSDYDNAIEHLRWAQELSRGTGNRVVEAAALHNLGRAYSQIGQPAQASAFCEESLHIYRAIGNRRGEAAALNYLGIAALLLGRPRTALDRHAEALELSTRIGHRQVQAAAAQGLGLTHWAVGDLGKAEQCYQDALAVCRRYGYRHGEVAMLVCLAETGCDRGTLTEAAVLVRQAIDQARQLGVRRHEVSGLDILATIQLRTGEWSAAADNYAEARGLAEEIRYSYGEASVLTGMGALCRRTGDRAGAIDHGLRALAMIDETGMRLLEARALTEVAQSYLDASDTAAALEYADRAITVTARAGQRLAHARALHVRALVRQGEADMDGARSDWQKALTVFEELAVPDAAHVRALLSAWAR
ncbi:tetratricopeptide repeat protein [Actinokineospora xionganensis]|uniref:Tetratricopeptide repeat protein n=1 Tax=Actinokineospora xionganensis TaxID=2684470 RepID=A0ABR7L5Z9_9PSEU|nr:tetratricopeptide repeat protein [Actinokineospora xionganensis]MBC6448110.1 tetratricopeptide repeat protein [Actinokineospora xionganensis]